MELLTYVMKEEEGEHHQNLTFTKGQEQPNVRMRNTTPVVGF